MADVDTLVLKLRIVGTLEKAIGHRPSELFVHWIGDKLIDMKYELPDPYEQKFPLFSRIPERWQFRLPLRWRGDPLLNVFRRNDSQVAGSNNLTVNNIMTTRSQLAQLIAAGREDRRLGAGFSLSELLDAVKHAVEILEPKLGMEAAIEAVAVTSSAMFVDHYREHLAQEKVRRSPRFRFTGAAYPDFFPF